MKGKKGKNNNIKENKNCYMDALTWQKIQRFTIGTVNIIEGGCSPWILSVIADK